MKSFLFHFAFIFIGIFYLQPSYSQTPKDNTKPIPPTTRILFIFDCSQSMAGRWESDKKINIARKFLIHTIDSLEKTEYTEMALRVYGHQSPVPPQDCGDTRLEVPFAKGNAPKIRQKLRYLIPKGTTPIANSLAQAANDFPECDNCRNIVILITDGIEKCDGDPCAVSTELQKEGIFLEPFIIGIGLDPDFRETFECVGKLYNADDESRFQQVLDVVITEALNSTTAQVNLLDQDGYPSETNVAMSFYDSNSGRLKYNYIHTINNRGKPDTIILDPLIEYRLVVHTLPPVIVDNIKVFKGKHNIIAADTPQGILNIKTKSTRYKNLKVLIRKSGDIQTINMQTVDKPEKYIIGKYDLEIPVLPRINVKDVTIKQSVTTTVSVPVPGIVTLLMTNPGYCSIYVEKGLELEWVYNVSSDIKHETIALQPGTYRIIYRPKFAKSIYYTSEKRVVVRSGSSQSVKLH